jgi:hypothetical protein
LGNQIFDFLMVGQQNFATKKIYLRCQPPTINNDRSLNKMRKSCPEKLCTCEIKRFETIENEGVMQGV